MGFVKFDCMYIGILVSWVGGYLNEYKKSTDQLHVMVM